MKKTYIKPEIEVIELDTETSMMSMSAPGEGGLDGTDWGGDGYNKEADANGRRGEWGNLWAQN